MKTFTYDFYSDIESLIRLKLLKHLMLQNNLRSLITYVLPYATWMNSRIENYIWWYELVAREVQWHSFLTHVSQSMVLEQFEIPNQ